MCLLPWTTQDPVDAIASAPTRKARQAATAAAAALTHHATAVAVQPCKLLVLSADDLRRFGRRVRGPLAEAAAARRDWLQQRLSAVQVGRDVSSLLQQVEPDAQLTSCDIAGLSGWPVLHVVWAGLARSVLLPGIVCSRLQV